LASQASDICSSCIKIVLQIDEGLGRANSKLNTITEKSATVPNSQDIIVRNVRLE